MRRYSCVHAPVRGNTDFGTLINIQDIYQFTNKKSTNDLKFFKASILEIKLQELLIIVDILKVAGYTFNINFLIKSFIKRKYERKGVFSRYVQTAVSVQKF